MKKSNEYDLRQQRTRLLLGEEKMERLNMAHVLVLGIGGVGSYASELLARAGVGELTLIDGDVVEKSNCNRQLPALSSTLGRPKVEVMGERILEINPAIKLNLISDFMQKEKIEMLLGNHFDYAVDAIDQLTPKIDFILGCRERKIPLISSMGSGGKTDPAQIQIADISKTYGCALARAVRTRLRAVGIHSGVKTVFSPEIASPAAIQNSIDETGHRQSVIGTISYLPAAFGCFCASVVLRGL